jgi:hypothetical protein
MEIILSMLIGEIRESSTSRKGGFVSGWRRNIRGMRRVRKREGVCIQGIKPAAWA